MKRHFHEELKDFTEDIIKMGLLVEEMISMASHSLFERDAKLAQRVIDTDSAVNQNEIRVDERAQALIALYQPTAVDLRFLIAAIKMNHDLERMGDHAVNVAERVLKLIAEPPGRPFEILPKMSDQVRKMVRSALDSFATRSEPEAREVLEGDDLVDNLNRELGDVLEESARKSPESSGRAFHLLMVGHNLERIADLATNIAEDVVYLVKAKEVRHHVEKK